MRHVSCSDFKRPDGKIDWDAHRKASEEARRLDVADGVFCRTCGSYLVLARGYSQECAQCQRLSNPEEFTHNHFVRCPACGVKCVSSDANSSGRDGLFGHGDHTVFCEECQHQYMVNTDVSFCFTSPALSIARTETPQPSDPTKKSAKNKRKKPRL